MVAKGHAFPVSLRRAHSPDAYLLLQEQAALDDKHLLDNRNYNAVALFSDRRKRVDFPVDRDSIDLYHIVC
jgi:hypothetical protein